MMRAILRSLSRSKGAILTFLLLCSLPLALSAQEGERETLKRNSFSITPFGDLAIMEIPKEWPMEGWRRAYALEKGLELQSNLALGDAGSGLLLGFSSSHWTRFWEEEREERITLHDLVFGLIGGYFKRVYPFRWSPRIHGGVTKLRFEYRHGFNLSRALNFSGDQLQLRAGFHHARPLQDPYWIDLGLRVGYMNKWPSIGGSGQFFGGWTVGLSLGFQIRTGTEGPFP